MQTNVVDTASPVEVPHGPPVLLSTVGQVLRRYGLTMNETRVRRAIASGRMAAERVGGRWAIMPRDAVPYCAPLPR